MVRSILALIAMSFTGTVLVAQNLPAVAEVTQRMQNRFEMIDDVRADFTQRVVLGYANIEQTFTGTILFRKPRQYRLTSEHQTLVTDGTTVWAYVPANGQVIIDSYKEQRNSVSPEQFLLTLPDAYYATVLSRETASNGNLLQLKLTPKDDRSFIRNVRLWMLESSMEVRRIVIVDQNETETTYTITSVRLNTNIDGSLFTFTPPEGTEVVDLR